MLSSQQRQRLLEIARASLRHAVGRGPAPNLPTDDPELTRPAGAFVTLKASGELRGCLGYTEPVLPLVEAVADLARAAALEDRRFPPVTPAEEPKLTITISILTPLAPVSDLQAIEIGRHGLVVEHDGHRGLLLPQVAVEWGWNREEFLRQTCIKAGLPPDAWKRGAQVYWFEAEVFGEDEPGNAACT